MAIVLLSVVGMLPQRDMADAFPVQHPLETTHDKKVEAWRDLAREDGD